MKFFSKSPHEWITQGHSLITDQTIFLVRLKMICSESMWADALKEFLNIFFSRTNLPVNERTKTGQTILARLGKQREMNFVVFGLNEMVTLSNHNKVFASVRFSFVSFIRDTNRLEELRRSVHDQTNTTDDVPMTNISQIYRFHPKTHPTCDDMNENFCF